VQMGTAFLTSTESGASDAYKRAVLEASPDSTTLTRAYSGRWARGIRNSFIDKSAQSAEPLPYPWQSALTSAMRAAALKNNDLDVMQMWSGQGTSLARAMPVAELMVALRREMHDAITGVSSLRA
jgi:nitronate monooxygenase